MVVEIRNRFGFSSSLRKCWKLIECESAPEKKPRNKQIQFPVTGDKVLGKMCEQRARGKKLKRSWSSSRYAVTADCAIIINWKWSRLAFCKMRNWMRLKTIFLQNPFLEYRRRSRRMQHAQHSMILLNNRIQVHTVHQLPVRLALFFGLMGIAR